MKKDAYRYGMYARTLGQPLSANPHPKRYDGAYAQWRAGWKAQDAALKWEALAAKGFKKEPV